MGSLAATTPPQLERPNQVYVESLGKDLFGAVSARVPRASSCLPILCRDELDTHLLWTYCHSICDESLTQPMIFSAVIATPTQAVLVYTKLLPKESRRISIRETLGKSADHGICFAWSQPEGRPGGFRLKNHRLAPIFYAFYQKKFPQGSSLDCLHSSASSNTFARERIFWVPQDGARVTAVVCAPREAYSRKPAKLRYTFGLKEGSGDWKLTTREIPFAPSFHTDLGLLFDTKFKSGSSYLCFVRGPKGKGWLLTETDQDFNLHHL